MQRFVFEIYTACNTVLPLPGDSAVPASLKRQKLEVKVGAKRRPTSVSTSPNYWSLYSNIQTLTISLPSTRTTDTMADPFDAAL